MSYFGTSINESPVIVVAAGEAIDSPAFLAISATGKVAAAGTNALGIALPGNDEAVAAGDDIDIQIKDIGIWTAGEAVAVGDELTVGAGGKAAKAISGKFILAVALEAAKEGQRIKVQIVKAGYKPASA